MKTKRRIQHIVRWIKQYARDHKISTLVVGVSGGIDSAVVSTLCAETGLDTVVLSMPIRQSAHTHDLSQRHLAWLTDRYPNVTAYTYDLTPVFTTFVKTMLYHDRELALANSRARFRMTCLYQVAQSLDGIVVGTGNRVEDFGVGFFTKYGDGGVDISPIGDCVKSEVWAMGAKLEIDPDIISAAPTDGLWSDQRTDEDQLGMTYPELEEAMRLDQLFEDEIEMLSLDKLGRSRLKQYRKIRARNMHKMVPIPVCVMPVDH